MSPLNLDQIAYDPSRPLCTCGSIADQPEGRCNRCHNEHYQRVAQASNHQGGYSLHQQMQGEYSELSKNLVPLHVEALSNTEQAAFLRAMAAQLELDPSVAKIAIALAIQFDDSTVMCPCNGFANDTQASRYFESFMRNQGFAS